MDFMLAAAGAAIANICMLGITIWTYIQNFKFLKSYFTVGLVIVTSFFIVQNSVIIVFWFKLYLAGHAIKNIVDAAAPYLFLINLAQTGGLSILVWISRR